MDFLLVLMELFSVGVTAEALREKINRKLAFCKPVGQYFHAKGDVPTNYFCTDS